MLVCWSSSCHFCFYRLWPAFSSTASTCQIRSLAPLTSLSSEPAATPPLRELYCAANKVAAVEGLAAFTALTLLELGSNRVRKIEGLEVGTAACQFPCCSQC